MNPAQTLLQDLQYATRVSLKSPRVALAILATIAIGVGANTTVFSVVNTTLLRPLPYANAERLMIIWQTNPKLGDHIALSAPNFLACQEQADVFDAIAIYQRRSFNIT